MQAISEFPNCGPGGPPCFEYFSAFSAPNTLDTTNQLINRFFSPGWSRAGRKMHGGVVVTEVETTGPEN